MLVYSFFPSIFPHLGSGWMLADYWQIRGDVVIIQAKTLIKLKAGRECSPS